MLRDFCTKTLMKEIKVKYLFSFVDFVNFFLVEYQRTPNNYNKQYSKRYKKYRRCKKCPHLFEYPFYIVRLYLYRRGKGSTYIFFTVVDHLNYTENFALGDGGLYVFFELYLGF